MTLTENSKLPELKSCPFCGAKAGYDYQDYSGDYRQDTWCVWCENGHGLDCMSETAEGIAEIWNQRI
jgi:phage/plasmid primase-like uncharacterized protein